LGLREPNAGDGPHLHHRLRGAGSSSELRLGRGDATRFGRIDAVIANAGILSTKRSSTRMTPRSMPFLAINVKVAAAPDPRPPGALGRMWARPASSSSLLSGKRVKAAPTGLLPSASTPRWRWRTHRGTPGWDKGIRATAICPGPVDTDMIRQIANLPQDQDDAAQRHRVPGQAVPSILPTLPAFRRFR